MDRLVVAEEMGGVVLATPPPGCGPNPYGEAEIDDDIQAQVFAVLEQLTPAQQEVIFAVYWEQRPLASIAREQGRTKPAVGQQRDRAFRRFRKLWEAGK